VKGGAPTGADEKDGQAAALAGECRRVSKRANSGSGSRPDIRDSFVTGRPCATASGALRRTSSFGVASGRSIQASLAPTPRATASLVHSVNDTIAPSSLEIAIRTGPRSAAVAPCFRTRLPNTRQTFVPSSTKTGSCATNSPPPYNSVTIILQMADTVSLEINSCPSAVRASIEASRCGASMTSVSCPICSIAAVRTIGRSLQQSHTYWRIYCIIGLISSGAPEPLDHLDMRHNGARQNPEFAHSRVGSDDNIACFHMWIDDLLGGRKTRIVAGFHFNPKQESCRVTCENVDPRIPGRIAWREGGAKPTAPSTRANDFVGVEISPGATGLYIADRSAILIRAL
jgi:hypothetical protein